MSAYDRVEDIVLSAESLERQLNHEGAAREVRFAVADLVAAALDLQQLLAASEEKR